MRRTSGLLGASSPISRAQAVAYADAVNLVAADVPGLQATQHQPKREAAAGPYRGAMNSCDNGAVRAGDVVGFSSPTFNFKPPLPVQSHSEGLPTASSVEPVPQPSLNSGRYYSVSSGVYFFKSEALARQYLAVADSARSAACVKRFASKEPLTVRREGSKVVEPMFTDPQVSTLLPVSLPGVQTYGLRLAAHSASGVRGGIETYEDFVSFMMGDAVITLNGSGLARPVPASTEQQLLERLYRRAQAHEL